jgi:hypothetical protein
VFVTASKYNLLMSKFNETLDELSALKNEWNEFLCHPDKHGGSKKAEEATVLLLEMLQ